MLITLSATIPSLPPAHCDLLFLFASTKVQQYMPFSKFHPLTRVLMWTYVNLWVLTPDKCPFFLQNTRLFCIFVVRLINTINQLCLSLIITIKTQINRRPSVAWSSPRVTFPSFCLALPGKSSRASYSKIPTFQASLSSVDERFFPQKSTLFTNIWGTRKVPLFRLVAGAETT